MQSYPKAFNIYRRIIQLLGLLLFGTALVFGWSDLNDPAVIVFSLLLVFAELLPVKFPGTIAEVTMTMPVALAFFLSHGAAPLILVSTITITLAMLITHRREYPPKRLLDLTTYHAAMSALSLATASMVYDLARGKAIYQMWSISNSGLLLIHCYLWVLVCTMLNTAADATGVYLYDRDTPWRVIFSQYIKWTIPNYIVTAPSALLFAYLYTSYHIYGILLVVIPFLVGRQALNQYADELGTYRETITTLGSYMQRYHPYTKGHLERVADIASKIAKELRLPTSSLMLIHDAGMLHDIGKVGVSEEILDKIGQLTDEEWNIIRQHPARGAEIISQLRYLEPIVPWVRAHHERPDGKGYPDALKNGQIPIEAAVIAVADAFDAMTGGEDKKDQRVYRTPLTLDQAIAQVRYGVGTQFDPRVVKAFLRVMAKEKEEKEEKSG